jgi:hypothetical protein
MIPHLACKTQCKKNLLHQNADNKFLDAHDYFHEGEGGIEPVCQFLKTSKDLVSICFAGLVFV